MPLTLAQIQALHNDNTTGDISAADGRAISAALFRVADPGLTPGENADDVNWDGNDVASGTTLAISGTETLVEQNGLLSSKFSGQSANDLGGVLFARTISIGDRWRMPVRSFHPNNSFTFTGICMSDGTAGTSNAFFAGMYADSAPLNIYAMWHGTLTNINTNGGELTSSLASRVMPWLYIELEYVAANSFLLRGSADGLQFIPLSLTAQAKTMTPTHVGPVWSVWGSAHTAVSTYGPLTKH